MEPAYAPRVGDVQRDRDRVLAVWSGNLGRDDAMAAKYRWFYQRTSGPPPLLQLLDHGPETVGACAAGIRNMVMGGTPLRAGVLVDLAVLPGHRSLGPALMLQEGLLEQARGLDLLYGFPNPKAAPVFRRMGYVHAADMQRHVRVVRHGRYFAQRLPTWIAMPLGILFDAAVRLGRRLKRPGLRHLDVVEQEGADARIEVLCRTHPLPHTLAADRTRAYLRWRLDEKPDAGARHALIQDRRNGALRAWFCWEAQGGTASILDYWSAGSPAKIEPACIEAFCRFLDRLGFTAIQLQVASPAESLRPWRSAGFRLRSARPLFIRWMGEAPADLALHLTAADEDE